MNLNDINSLKENKNHGNSMLPLTVYEATLIKGVHDLFFHWHDELEIIYIESGSGTFQVNLESYEVKSGDILVIQPGTIHNGEGFKDAPLHCKTIVFNLDMLKSIMVDATVLKFLNPIINKEFCSTILINKNSIGYSNIASSLKGILSSYENNSYGYQLEIKGLLFIFLSQLFSNKYFKVVATADSSKNKKVERLKSVIDYIQSNYNKPISIKELATVVNYSEFHFIRFFREQTGLTCVQYINLIRLDMASRLLKETSLSITEISLDVGFDNVSYFIRVFKNKYGLTPDKYRKSIKHP